MKRILYILLSILPTTLLAQSVQLKVGGGFASHYGQAKVVGAYKIGLGYEIEFNQHFTFTPSLEFYGKGWKDPNQQVYVFDDEGQQRFDPETGKPLIGIKSRTATQNYIELPLLLSYYLRTGESRYLVFRAGPYVAYGVGGKQKTKGDTEQSGVNRYYYEQKTFNEPGTHRFDYGVQTYVGYQFPTSFTIGLEADWGIGKFNAQGRRNVSALISLGYKLWQKALNTPVGGIFG